MTTLRRGPLLRGTGRAALLLGLLSGVPACARQEMPPGGETDRRGPAVVAITPEPFSTTQATDEPIRIQFSERISEQPTAGQLDDAVLVSPASGVASVSFERDALEVELSEGLIPGVVYRVTVRPVVKDMFGNAMREPFEFVFSTGGEFHQTAVAGLVLDRVTGQQIEDAVILATAEGQPTDAASPVVYFSRTDTGGVYTLRYLPPGRYQVTGFQDRDRDRLPDPFEVQGATLPELGPADTTFADFPVLEPDTTPARLVRVEAADSTALRLTFDDFLDPDVSLARLAVSLEPAGASGGAPAVTQVLHEHRYLAVRAATQGAAAPAGADTAADADTIPAADAAADADTIPAAGDTVPGGGAGGARPPVRRGGDYVGRAQGADSASAALLGLTLPSRVAYAELSDTLPYGVPFVLRLREVVNLAGLASAVDSLVFTRELPAAPAAPSAPAAAPGADPDGAPGAAGPGAAPAATAPANPAPPPAAPALGRADPQSVTGPARAGAP